MEKFFSVYYIRGVADMKNELQIEERSSLKSNSTDLLVSLLKAILGVIPYGGSAASEITSWLIPNQRLDRICDFIEHLATQIEKLENIQNEWIEKLGNSKSNLLLFELATIYSMETNSNILHHCYAYLIFNAIENKTLEDSRNEKLLRTLSELTEEEVVHLINFAQSKGVFYSSEFDEKYEGIIMPKSQTGHISENDIHNTFRDAYIVTLEQKGLITIGMKYNGTKLPIANNDVQITDYGSLLVEAIYDENFFGKLERMTQSES